MTENRHKTDMPFKKGNKLGRHGKQNPPGGRPTNKEIEKKKAQLEGMEKARATVEKELVGKVAKLAERYTNRALQKNADKVLMDAIKKIMPDAKQALDANYHGDVVIVTNVDPFAGRKR